jgi:alkanesulfonate monooxygenase SsuD/methylene tetrahydromethanopterin reductase-like flavin-dependent oxidoreductase (luciferase family)
VAQAGDGWFGYNHTPESAAERLGVLDRLLADAGRSRDDLKVVIAPTGRPTREMIEQFAELGVHELVLRTATRRVEDAVERLESLAGELMPATERV